MASSVGQAGAGGVRDRPAGRLLITALRKAGRDQVFSLEGVLAAWRVWRAAGRQMTGFLRFRR